MTRKASAHQLYSEAARILHTLDTDKSQSVRTLVFGSTYKVSRCAHLCGQRVQNKRALYRVVSSVCTHRSVSDAILCGAVGDNVHAQLARASRKHATQRAGTSTQQSIDRHCVRVAITELLYNTHAAESMPDEYARVFRAHEQEMKMIVCYFTHIRFEFCVCSATLSIQYARLWYTFAGRV
jgi:hypothetical protein